MHPSFPNYPPSNLKSHIFQLRKNLPIISFDLTKYNDDYRRKFSDFDGYFFYQKGESLNDEEDKRNAKTADKKIETANCFFRLAKIENENSFNELQKRAYYSIGILILDEKFSFHYGKSFYVGYKSENYAMMICFLYVLRKLRELKIKRVNLEVDEDFLEVFTSGVCDAVDPFHLKVCQEIDINLGYFEEISPLPEHTRTIEFCRFAEKLAQKKIDKERSSKNYKQYYGKGFAN